MRTVVLVVGLSFTAGALVGLGELARLAWFVPGTTFPPIVVAYAVAIDGGLGAAIGLVLTMIGAIALRIFRRAPSAKSSEPTTSGTSRRSFLRASALAMGSMGLLSVVPVSLALARRSSFSSSPRVNNSLSDSVSVEVAQAQKPNVILVTIDTLRADQLGCYGHPFVATPMLDAFAKQGAQFALHTVQQPQTNPSHATLFTGMYPSSSGIRVHMVDKLPDSLDSMATLFAAAGYQTAGLYSWMSLDPQYSNFQRGFQVYANLAGYDGTSTSNPAVKDLSARFRVAEEYLAAPKAAIQMTGVKQSVETAAKGRADATTDGAIAQLRAFGSSPFFLWIHYFDPHYPFQPPANYASMYDPDYVGPITSSIQTIYDIEQGKLHPSDLDAKYLMALYQGEISFLDSHLGRLFSAIDDLGLTSTTVVAVTGDHGESFGEHTQLEESGNFFHPHSLYGVEQRVPLLLRFPGHVNQGTVVAAPSQAIDVLPTLLDYAGLPIPAQVQGKSLTPLVSGTDQGVDRVAFSAMPDYVFTSITTSRWKLIQNNGANQRLLFDLSSDPGELTDVSATQADAATQLGARLTSWMKAVKISS